MSTRTKTAYPKSASGSAPPSGAGVTPVPSRAEVLRSARRVLVKIGTGVLTAAGGRFDRPRFEGLCEELGRAARSHELVVVSSGAVALGVERLGLRARPKDIRGKQAAAAVGQSLLMRLYDDALGPRGVTVAQVLLTHADIQSRTRYLNARHAIAQLIAHRALPIINENDTVSVEELRFGDNDTLAGMAVDLVEADLLVILTDIDGLYTADPRSDKTARRIPELYGIDDATLALAGGTSSGVGTGGMATKLRAARRAGESGVPTLIVPGKRVGVLDEILSGAPPAGDTTASGDADRSEPGTFVRAPVQAGSGSRKRWLARDLRPAGQLLIDEGAAKALCERGTSLLPRGVREVRGAFDTGEPVDICAPDGRVLARGLTSYSADELRRLIGVRTSEIAAVLGEKLADEAVHRDDLVLLDRHAPARQGA